MKKLMIAAAVALVALASQAASTSWKVTAGNLKSYDGTSATAAYTGIVEIWASGGDLSAAVKIADLTPTSGTLNKVEFSTQALTASTTYGFTYYLNNGSYELTSGTLDVKAHGSSVMALNWGNQASYTGNAGNWTAVPEPTSGLLMLLGIAGLALKRKRA